MYVSESDVYITHIDKNRIHFGEERRGGENVKPYTNNHTVANNQLFSFSSKKQTSLNETDR